MIERLSNHLLMPQTWIPRANGNIHVARHYQNEVEPVSEFRMADYTDTLDGRLMLLSNAEWELLGFAVSISPFFGKIQKSINGKFRKAVAGRFDDGATNRFDAIPTALSTEITLSLLPINCWNDTQTISFGGIAAIKAIGNFTPTQHKILAARFPDASPSVSQLTIQLVEELCKISLPNLPWLFEDMPSKSLTDELN